MSAIGLHYPGLTFQDETWLKAALLYWPKMARIDLAWIHEDCEAARRIRGELDFFLDIGLSERAREELGESLSQLLDAEEEALVSRYDLSRLFPDARVHPHYGVRLDSAQRARLRWVHPDKMQYELWQRLMERGLAAEGGPGNTIGMHPRLANTYLCALAGIVAAHNQLEPVTDEPDIHGALTSWDPAALRAALLSPPALPGAHQRHEGTAEQVFATLAIETVLAGDLRHVPLEQVIAARRALGEELVAFREFVRSLSGEISQLATVEDPRAREAHLRHVVDTQVQPRVRELEKGMRLLKLEPVRAVLSWKDVPVPAVVAGLAALGGVPAPVTVAATGAVLTIATVVNTWRRGRQMRAESPVGYLLDLKNRLPVPPPSPAAESNPRRGLARFLPRLGFAR